MGGESDLHKYLKLLAMIYLDEHGCFGTATEVYVRRKYDELLSPLDNKQIIDVVGVGVKPIMVVDKIYADGYKSHRKIGEEIVLRGIEVKVSRADFKNGFVASGCNYNYILAPMGMLKKSEIPKGVGFLEFDPTWKYRGQRLQITKRPRYKPIDEFYITKIRHGLAQREHNTLMVVVRDWAKGQAETHRTTTS